MSWHILMKGAIVQAGEGDLEAARRAKALGHVLIEQHRYNPPTRRGCARRYTWRMAVVEGEKSAAVSLADQRLKWASFALLAAIVLHDLDHIRQDRSVEPLVVGIGIIGDIAIITLVVLVMRGHRLAPLAATVIGFANILGFIAVHMVPDWGPLSDGYPDLPVDALSWVLAAIPMAAALWLALGGWVSLRATRRLA